MGALRVVRAGAGSGKTTRLCEVVAKAVVGGIDPARVLATTFTRKAAAELKGRIQARLLDDPTLSRADRLAKAERLELALIGTVHSIGLQLLSRYALPLGFSPKLTVLEEAGSARSLHDLLGEMPLEPWERLALLTHRLSLDAPQTIVLELLHAKRGNRIPDDAFREQMAASAERLVTLMASGGASPEPLRFEGLYVLIESVLARLDGLQDATERTRQAKADLRRLLDARAGIWADYCRTAGVEAGKASGADRIVGGLRAAAGGALSSPDLHRDIRELLARLADQTLELEHAYDAYKRARGFLDFTDLEVWLLRLLETPDLAASLAADVALVVVDEFHDTSPLQLAVFQRLRALVAESFWVGDSKQSIYAFRGTDPELVRAVWDGVPASARDRLETNYRSQAGLVRLVGRVFGPVFGDEAVLRPHREAAPQGVERWILEARNKPEEVVALARGIGALREQGRSLRDVAVLARTNDHARDIGTALRAAGLPVLLEIPGLLATREGALVMAGLRLILDRHDSLAAATVLHLLGDPRAETPPWLAERLAAVRDRETVDGPMPVPWAGDPRLAPLDRIDYRLLPPGVALGQVIQALRVGDAIRRWGRAAERLANLDTLLIHAAAYEEEMRLAGGAATLPGLITYLESLAGEEKDITQPPYGIEAVTVLTYHGAKGLEWPVVILTQLDSERDPEMWKVRVTGGDPAAGDPLGSRAVRYWPWPFGNLSRGTNLKQLALRSPEGQEAQAQSEAESLRLLYVGFTRARDVLVLAHRKGKCAWLAKLGEVDRILPPDLQEGEHPLDGIETSYVLRRFGGGAVQGEALQGPRAETWLEELHGTAEAPVDVPRYWSPSQVEARVDPGSVTVEALAGEPVFPRMEEAQEVALGDAVHAYLTALPSLDALGPREREGAARRCLQGFGVEALLSADRLAGMGERLREWVAARYPEAAWHTEVPVTAPRESGGQWNGSIDLLLRLPDGSVVIVDHKSSPIPRDQCAAKAATYAGQLAAYREALTAQGLTVAGTWIHFPLVGAVASLPAA